MKPESCPDENVLVAYAEHALDERARAALEAHLDTCPACLAIASDVAHRSDVEEPESAGDDITQGTQLAKYTVLRIVGQGGMGTVYEGFDPNLQRRVALKVVRADYLAEQRMQEQLLREARAMAKLSHPNIVTVYEVGEVGDRVFVAMEFIEGVTLAAWLDAAPRPWPAIVRVFLAAGAGIIALHAAGIVHRDFKPANVLVDDEGRVAVADFGLAIARSDDASHATSARTESERIAGTPAFMSPEQLGGVPIDARSDAFSFAVALYRALYGQHPFEGATPVDLLAAMRQGRVRPAPAKSPVPRAVHRALARSLAARPEDRYPTMDAFVTDLARAARTPTRARAWSLLIGVMVIVATLAFVRARAVAPPLVTAKAPDAGAVYAFPVPASDVPAARAAYVEGIQGFRDGSHPIESFENAAKLDPTMAAAFLRASLLRSDRYPDVAREAFQHADQLRARLTPRDREVLDAFRPIVQTVPQDLVAATVRLDAIAAKYPDDWEIAYYQAGFAGQRGDIDGAARAAKRALAADPEFVAALFVEATLEAYLGNFEEALRISSRCSELSPSATMCMAIRVGVLRQEGTCEDVARETRAFTTAHPDRSTPYQWLASALVAQGAPEPTIAETLRRATELDLESRRRADALRDTSRLATLRGDFATAERAAREWLEATAKENAAKAHAEPSTELVEIYSEMGDLAGAGRVARDHLARLGAWTPDGRAEDTAISGDSRPFMVHAERRGGIVTRAEEDAARGRYLGEWRARVSPFFGRYLWVHAYASLVDDEEQARAALEALGDEVVPPYRPGARGDGRIGWTYFLAGDVARALPLLEREARACTVLQDPFESTRTLFRVGRAREASGDTRGACAAYATVLARWGAAKLASVTAAQARKRSAALRCAP